MGLKWLGTGNVLNSDEITFLIIINEIIFVLLFCYRWDKSKAAGISNLILLKFSEVTSHKYSWNVKS